MYGNLLLPSATALPQRTPSISKMQANIFRVQFISKLLYIDLFSKIQNGLYVSAVLYNMEKRKDQISAPIFFFEPGSFGMCRSSGVFKKNALCYLMLLILHMIPDFFFLLIYDDLNLKQKNNYYFIQYIILITFLTCFLKKKKNNFYVIIYVVVISAF